LKKKHNFKKGDLVTKKDSHNDALFLYLGYDDEDGDPYLFCIKDPSWKDNYAFGRIFYDWGDKYIGLKISDSTEV
jgi:hypothetical protein